MKMENTSENGYNEKNPAGLLVQERFSYQVALLHVTKNDLQKHITNIAPFEMTHQNHGQVASSDRPLEVST